MRFIDLGLHPDILRAIVDQGYTTPTPIQAQAIPIVAAGRDLMGGAQTGTGKTAAFTLPLLHRLSGYATSNPSPARHPVRALILAPTRELAVQVHDNLRDYGKYLPFRTLCAYGGVDIRPQIEEIRKGVEFLVATPGRLLDLVEQKLLHFNSVEALVLDEADRMLDMGFIPDVQRILNLLPKNRQSLLFSATFSEEIKKLAATMLRDPVTIQVAARNTVSDTITHRVYQVAENDKRSLLIHLLAGDEIPQSLVFVRTKQGCGRLARELVRAGVSADAIHGDKSQIERMKALDAFKQGSVRVLVGTDVAARGLDIDELPYVINYELPHVPEDYVHRIGRTGRAGKLGNAISLVCDHEMGYLADIEKLIKRPIERMALPGFESDGVASGSSRAAGSGRGGRDRHEGGKRPEGGSRGRHGEAKYETPRPRREHAPRPPERKSTVAADGFDYSKPYEPSPAAAPLDDKPHPKPDPHKPKRPVAAILGGFGKR
ncbi:MAG TPA: DEAD/DEAH box helicase [Rhodocyclaceae bacterium]